MILYQGDCLEMMKDLPNSMVDMILADLPYGTTKLGWDKIIPFPPLWNEYKRILKNNGVVILTAVQPFASSVVMSNPEWFKYELIWEKDKGTDFGNANRKILNAHENILIFYNETPTYNKQHIKGKPYKRVIKKRTNHAEDISFTSDNSGTWINEGTRTPKSVMKFNRVSAAGQKPLHPTEKPVELLEFLIKSYTNEGDIVLDNVMGSGSTGEACINTNRGFIGMELDEYYYEIAKNRLVGVGNN